MQKWLQYTATKAARHKLARFVREHSHLPLESGWGAGPVVQLSIQVPLSHCRSFSYLAARPEAHQQSDLLGCLQV